MKTIFLWKGYHSLSLQKSLSLSWERGDLFIICPPHLKEVSFFLPFLPSGKITFIGLWEEKREDILHESPVDYPTEALFGVFTTGTEREKPRLVLYSEENIKSSIDGIFHFFQNEDIRFLFCYPSPFHVFGMVLGYLTSLYKGLELFVEEGMPTPMAHQYWLDIPASQRKYMMTLGTPTHFKDLIYYIEKTARSPLPSRTSIVGGAITEISLWHQMQDILHIQRPSIGYGCTEASLGVTHLAPGIPPRSEGVIGQSLPHLNLTINDEGLCLKGKGVCLAIIEEDNISFPKTYVIKDHITYDAELDLYFYKGRKDNLLNRGGEKYLLEEIESLILHHTGLSIVCLSRPHPRLGEELALLMKRDDISQKERIFVFLKEHYHKNFDSENVVAIDLFPLNANSKINRKECKRILHQCL